MSYVKERQVTAKQPAQFTRLMNLAQAPRIERVTGIRSGLQPDVVAQLVRKLGLTQERVFEMLALKRATVKRKVASKTALSPADSERVLGLFGLLASAESFKPYTRDPQAFDSATWLAGWLETANPALGGSRPGDLLDTVEGQGIVRQLLEQQWSGTYA